MMGRQTGDQSQLFYLFNLEDRIPERHLLRRINPIVTGVRTALPGTRNAGPLFSKADIIRIPVITSKSCAAILKASIRSASTSNGGSSSSGMAAGVKRQASIWTTIVIGEVSHVDDEA
jgi:hypothetical protein